MSTPSKNAVVDATGAPGPRFANTMYDHVVEGDATIRDGVCYPADGSPSFKVAGASFWVKGTLTWADPIAVYEDDDERTD